MGEYRVETTSISGSIQVHVLFFSFNLLGKSRHTSVGEYRLQTTSSSGSLHVLFPSVYLQFTQYI